jgi:hypothetical protein
MLSLQETHRAATVLSGMHDTVSFVTISPVYNYALVDFHDQG